MIKFRGRPRAGRRVPDSPRTTISFGADDLVQLARLVAAGQVLLQSRPAVVSRLKAALTRMRLPVPQGL